MKKNLYRSIRSCHRKAKFNHPNHAKSKANEIMYRDGTMLYHYECKDCGQYHLTKDKRAEGKLL